LGARPPRLGNMTPVVRLSSRIWRLYMAASALNFEAGRTQIRQVLAVISDAGASGLPLRTLF
jgi:cyclopropane-fatty-acyl-phospholipid synthase